MSIARFEKVSLGQFIHDCEYYTGEPAQALEALELPRRATKQSAGYDFTAAAPFVINPGESVLVATGVKCWIENGWVLMLYPRSSLGFKGMKLANTTGVIDADYYNNVKNEGHIMAKVVNTESEPIVIKAGERFIQGVFLPFGTAEEDEVTAERIGGTGSSGN